MNLDTRLQSVDSFGNPTQKPILTPVRIAVDSSTPLANILSGQTFDGITLAVGDRVLWADLSGGGSSTTYGIYSVYGPATAPTFDTDWALPETIINGSIVQIAQGTTYGGCTATIYAASTLVNAPGLILPGKTSIKVLLDARTTAVKSRLDALTGFGPIGVTDLGTTPTIVLNYDNTTIGINASTQIAVPDSGIDSAQIKDSAVTSAKIADGTIVNADISTTAAIAASKISGTAVVDADSRLTNARTPTAHASTHASGGTDPLTAATTSVAGIVQLTDSTTSTSTTTAATANAVKAAVDRVRESFNSTSSVYDVIPRAAQMTGQAATSGHVNFSFFTSPSNMTISQISYASAAATSSGLTLARFGLYTFDGTTATLVARTASDTTIFNTSSTVYAKSFATSGGYPATYDLVAGSRYAIGLVLVGTTPGNPVGITNITTVLGLAPRINGVLTGQTDLPTSTSSFGAPTVLYWGRVS